MTEPNNPYEAPESVLESSVESVGGSVESAIRGEYSFKIGEVLGEAWELSNGFKGTFWGATLLLIAVNIGAGVLTNLVEGNTIARGVIQIGSTLLLYPLNAGVVMLCVYRAAGRQVQAAQVTAYFPQIIRIVLLNIVASVLILVGLLLFVLPGIYLAIGYLFAIPLLLDKNLKIWDALEVSRKTVTHYWFRYLGLGLVLGFIVMFGAVLLGIGLIWAVPLAGLAIGVLYVGVLGADGDMG